MIALVRPSRISGSVEAPQSKSIAIRLLFSALLGQIRLENLQQSDDVRAAAEALQSIGVSAGGNLWQRKSMTATPGTMNLGGSGTTLRMIIPVLSCLGIPASIDGDLTLRNRPIITLSGWLRENGIEISADRLPLKISGKLRTDTVEISGAESSQYISGFIFGLLLSGGGKIVVLEPVRSRSYIEMTCAVLNDLGAEVAFRDNTIYVEPLEKPLSYDGEVPGDFLLSSFYALGAALTRGKVDIMGLSRPEWSGHDRRIVDVMAKSGIHSSIEGDIWKVSAGSPVLALNESIEDSPDMSVSLAAMAAVATGTSRVSGIALLRTKESDRIRSISETLESFGVGTKSNQELVIDGRENLVHGTVRDWRDHRIAMLGTVLALRTGGRIEGAESVSKSNPRFFNDMIGLGGDIQFA